MFRRLVAVIVCLVLVTNIMGQSDERPFEGTTLNFL